MRGGRTAESDDTGVPLSPLIDCVFLLLIFFLVTSVLKRYERQIPVTLADPTAAVSATLERRAVLVGLDAEGNVYAATGRSNRGVVQFAPIGVPLGQHLDAIASASGVDEPIELVVERDTPFQVVIETLDAFELRGFEDVGTRVRPSL